MDTEERDELLIELRTDVKRLAKVIEGNGQPGLFADVTTLKTEHQSVVAELDEIKNRLPNQKERIAAWTTIGVALIGAVGGWISNGGGK